MTQWDPPFLLQGRNAEHCCSASIAAIVISVITTIVVTIVRNTNSGTLVDGPCACGDFTLPFSEALAACLRFIASLIRSSVAQTGTFAGYFPVKQTKNHQWLICIIPLRSFSSQNMDLLLLPQSHNFLFSRKLH